MFLKSSLMSHFKKRFGDTFFNNCIFRPATNRQLNWLGTLFMRFGAGCCPSWDPSNWFSRKIPKIMTLWMSKSNENQKLLRTESEEEVFKKKPKRNKCKCKKGKKSESETNLNGGSSNVQVSVEIVTESEKNLQKTCKKAKKSEKSESNTKNNKKSSNKMEKQESIASAASMTSMASITDSSLSEANSLQPRRRRSRRSQAALAAKSSRGGGKAGTYTAANLRRYAAERKPKEMFEKRSQSANALKISYGIIFDVECLFFCKQLFLTAIC